MPPILKKILTLVLAIIAGFVTVVGVVSLQLREVSSNVKAAGDLQIPLFRAAVDVHQHSAALESLVAKAFLSLDQGDLEQTRQEAVRTSEKLQAAIQTICGPRFDQLHTRNLGFKKQPQAPGSSNQTDLTVGVLLSRVSTNAARLNEATTRTFSLASEQLESRRSLASAREELSKVFRAGSALANLSAPGYANLSRAVLTVLHSNSTRDLNFVGRAKFKDGREALLKAISTPEQQAKLDAISLQFTKTFELASATSAGKADFTFFESRMLELLADTAALKAFAETEFEKGQETVSTKTGSTVKLGLLLSCLMVVAGTTIAFLLARSITSRIATVVAQLRTGASRVGAASLQLQSNSAALSEGASSQAASLQETGASLCEMASKTKQTSGYASKAKKLSTDTRITAETGSRHVREMEEAMRDIKTSSDSIVKIVKSIDELAFQTNILALNAAVEAARAGDAGLGFAVVAIEVRHLAQRSAAAAQDTSEKIEDSIQKSERGVRISTTVAQSLQSIMTKATSMDDLISDIAAAANEQHSGIDQINSAVQQIDRITQSSAGNAQETSQAADALQKQSEELMDSVETLVDLVGEGKATSESAPVAPIAGIPNGSVQSESILVLPPPQKGAGRRQKQQQLEEDNFFATDKLPKSAGSDAFRNF